MNLVATLTKSIVLFPCAWKCYCLWEMIGEFRVFITTRHFFLPNVKHKQTISSFLGKTSNSLIANTTDFTDSRESQHSRWLLLVHTSTHTDSPTDWLSFRRVIPGMIHSAIHFTFSICSFISRAQLAETDHEHKPAAPLATRRTCMTWTFQVMFCGWILQSCICVPETITSHWHHSGSSESLSWLKRNCILRSPLLFHQLINMRAMPHIWNYHLCQINSYALRVASPQHSRVEQLEHWSDFFGHLGKTFLP